MMKNLLIALMFFVTFGLMSCAKVAEDIAAPSEPADTDELLPRVEPKKDDGKYNPLVEEEIESDEAPLETEEMEDQPLFK